MSEFVPLQHSHVSVCIGCLITLLFARLGFFLTEAAYQHGDATIFLSWTSNTKGSLAFDEVIRSIVNFVSFRAIRTHDSLGTTDV